MQSFAASSWPLFHPPLPWQTPYTYTGNAFTTFSGDGVFLPSDSITGSFTVSSPLDANLTLGELTPTATSVSFSNGIDTVSGVPTNLQVGTDPTGAINLWYIDFITATGQYVVTINTGSTGNYLQEDYGQNNNQFYGYNLNAPGKWSSVDSSAPTDPSPSAVPEPSSLFLLGTGALGLAGSLRRKLAI
jgi:PEP-CTERM motif